MGLPSGSKRAPATRRPPSASASAAIRPTSCSPRRSSSRCCSPAPMRLICSARCARVVLDELHSLVTSKRGDLLSLGLARLFALAPQLTTVGLSATVAEPDDLAPLSGAAAAGRRRRAPISSSRKPARSRRSTMLDTAEHLPWAGHSARHALGEIYELIKRHKTTLVFVNTRSQAEFIFQELWRHQRRQSRHRAASRLARRRAAPQGRGRHGRAANCARWCAPRRSISASTGATSISSSMSARRRAPRG